MWINFRWYCVIVMTVSELNVLEVDSLRDSVHGGSASDEPNA